ncbi:MAG: NnrS family protein [Lautropia sp.]|nr:NnrS family protein [Lautropia sp.]
MLHTIEEPAPVSTAPSWRAFLELGFRPLYPLGCAWAAIAIILWVYTPWLLQAPLGGLFWHAHEMLWGFIITIAVGFLFTAGATWTGINPIKGRALGSICLLWLVARIGYLIPSDAVFWLAVTAESLFFGWAALAMANSIYRAKSQRNYGIPPLMLLMGVSNLAFLVAVWEGDGERIMRFFHTGMITMAIVALLVARRVIPFFAMRAVENLTIPMQLKSGQWQLGFSMAAVAFSLLDWAIPAAGCLAMAGLIALVQLASWKPQAVLHKPILWVLYAGYFWLGIGLMAAAAQQLAWAERAVWPVHLIGIGGFSVLIIGMVTRTALGHLGRPLQTDTLMVSCYWLMLGSLLLRLAALLAPPKVTLPLLHSSALLWVLVFTLYLWRFVPMLIRPRADEPRGKNGTQKVIIRPAVITKADSR